MPGFEVRAEVCVFFRVLQLATQELSRSELCAAVPFSEPG